MEKTCEFCGAPRPVVYCQADMAFLCLSCDAKVHSANALSGRHSRSLVCDWCRMNPASVRCLDHLLLLCRGCETRVHHDQTGLVGQGHRNQVMGSFTGCPSANHFAALWGISTAGEVGGQGLDRRRGGAQFGSRSHVSSDDLSTGEFKHPGSVAAAAKGGVSSQRHKQALSHEQEQKNHLIMQQILELEKLQLTEGNNGPSSLLHRHHRESVKSSSSTYNTSGNSDESLGRQSKELEYPLINDLGSFNNQSQDLKDGRLPSPISQLDQLSCSSAVGEPFWQYKGPIDSSQFWSQNMQDLGMCEDLGSLDDLNIPDVDPTFRNFDDLFTNDVDLSQALLEDDDMIFSNIHKGTSVENGHSKNTTEDVSAGSSISIRKHIRSKHKEKAYDNHSVGYSQHMMRSASFSRSRLSAESSGSECLDSGHSGSFFMQEASNGNAQVQEDGVYNERKKARLVHGKQSQLAPRKAKGDMHKRIKGRVVSMEGYESDSMNATKSY